MKKVLSQVMCIALLSLTFMCDSAHVQAEEQEKAEVHIITEEDFELLHITHDDYHIDTCLLVSQEDAQRLMKIAYVEDHTSIESQAAVMACILNRVESPDFPNTIQGVIEQEGQFSTVTNGEYFDAEPNVDSHYALALIESRQVESDALYFEAAYAKNTWQSNHLIYISTVGGTRYYK